jgi:hypothetical protein
MNNSPVRVFIGSGEASLLERKVFQYSLKKHSRRDLEIYVFNGTHNAVEPPNGEPFVAPMSLKAKYTSVTEFSNYRFLIPQLCNYEGRAIYVDSDMIALADIGELFDADMGGADMLAKGEAYGGSDEAAWGLSVTLFDCEKCRFDLDRYVRETEQGLYTYYDFHRMAPKFLAHHPFTLKPIDPNWNVFDQYDEHTKLIHYTDLRRQPWKYPGHPYGDIWFRYLDEARKAGAVTDKDIEISKIRAYVRTDVLEGNNPKRPGAWLRAIRRPLGRIRRALKS